MNSSRTILRAIKKTNTDIKHHQQQLQNGLDDLIPSAPYLYAMPVVAFLLGLRYAKLCARLLSLPSLRTYSIFLPPLFKE